jgi:hypothetical protein
MRRLTLFLVSLVLVACSTAAPAATQLVQVSPTSQTDTPVPTATVTASGTALPSQTPTITPSPTETLTPTATSTSTATPDPNLGQRVTDFFRNYKTYIDISKPGFFSDWNGNWIGINFILINKFDGPYGTSTEGLVTPILLGIYDNGTTTNVILGAIDANSKPFVWAGVVGYSGFKAKVPQRLLISGLIRSKGNHVRINHNGTYDWDDTNKLADQLQLHLGEPVLVKPTIFKLDPAQMQPDGSVLLFPANLEAIYLSLQGSEVVQPIFDVCQKGITGPDYVIRSADGLSSIVGLTKIPLFSQIMTTER